MFRTILFALAFAGVSLFPGCSTFKNAGNAVVGIFKKAPAANAVQTEVTTAVGVARTAASLNPGIAVAVNGYIGTIHQYLIELQSGTNALPDPITTAAFLDRQIQAAASALPVSMQAKFIQVVDDLEDAVMAKYAAFYGAVADTKPYITALIIATA